MSQSLQSMSGSPRPDGVSTGGGEGGDGRGEKGRGRGEVVERGGGGNMLCCERGGGLTTDQHKIYAFLKLACPSLNVFNSQKY